MPLRGALALAILLAGCPVPAPDVYEPNDTLDDHHFLGDVEGTGVASGWEATLSPRGDRDFYGFTAAEATSLGFPGTPQVFTLTIRLVPPQGENYDLFLYSDSGSELARSTVPGSAEDVIALSWDGTAAIPAAFPTRCTPISWKRLPEDHPSGL